MKIAIIHGSARKGNTYTLVEAIRKEMQTMGRIEFRDIYLHSIRLDYCISCHRCFTRGHQACPQYGKVSEIEDALKEADGFIIAAPVYAMQINAATKNLIDLLSYMIHRPRLANKKALTLVTTAGAGEGATIKYLSLVLQLWGVNRTHQLGVKVMAKSLEIDERLNKKVKQTAREFYRDVDSNTLHSPGLWKLFYYNLFRALYSLMPDSLDNEYWQRNQMLSHSFFPEVKMGLIKRIFGQSLFRLMRALLSAKT